LPNNNKENEDGEEHIIKFADNKKKKTPKKIEFGES